MVIIPSRMVVKSMTDGNKSRPDVQQREQQTKKRDSAQIVGKTKDKINSEKLRYEFADEIYD